MYGPLVTASLTSGHCVCLPAAVLLPTPSCSGRFYTEPLWTLLSHHSFQNGMLENNHKFPSGLDDSNQRESKLSCNRFSKMDGRCQGEEEGEMNGSECDKQYRVIKR